MASGERVEKMQKVTRNEMEFSSCYGKCNYIKGVSNLDRRDIVGSYKILIRLRYPSVIKVEFPSRLT